MMIQTYTNFLPLLERLKTLYSDIEIIDSITELDPIEVVITEPRSALKLIREIPEIKIMVLSDEPSFTEGQLLLYKGIKGYASTYIHLTHLDEAIETINSGNIWLHPTFMQDLIAHAFPHADTKDEILDKLTLREQETALLVSQGRTNKEIAIELKITERTAKAHVSSIFEKTGISDRLALAIILR